MAARAWLPWLALALILAGQLHYLPQRLALWRELSDYARATDRVAATRLAYPPGDYDLLEWVAANTPADTTLLLVTAGGNGPSDMLYHRALYHLYPRRVWWSVTMGPARGYPIWGSHVVPDRDAIEARARAVGARVVLESYAPAVRLAGRQVLYDWATRLIFLEEAP